MKLKQKKHFFFGINKTYNVARIFLKRSYTNIFVTLADLNNKVIICKTSGSSGITGSKRRKKAPQAVETILASLQPFLKLYKITKVELILKMRITQIFHLLVKELSYYSIEVLGFFFRRRIAFNGVRGRKLRRI